MVKIKNIKKSNNNKSNNKSNGKYKKEQKQIVRLSQKEKLLKFLIENKNPQSIRGASGAIIIDYKNTHNIVNEFYPEVISKEKIGNTNLIRLNIVPNQDIYMVEDKRTKEFLFKNPGLSVIKKYVEEINYPFFIVLVFGSYAKDTKTEKSDIDICIISDNKDKERELIGKLNLLSLRLGIHEFTTKEFTSMIEKSQNNLGHEIIKKNIIIYGIENYYNLISKWMKKE